MKASARARAFGRSLPDLWFVLPALILFIFVVVVPFFRGFGIAFTNWDGFSPKQTFVGFRNFLLLLTDSALLPPLWNTLYFTGITVVMVNILGLAVALGVDRKFPGVGVVKTIFFLPIVVSLVLASFIWSYLFSDVFPRIFHAPGLLGSADTVMSGLALICLWRDTGLAMLTYLAALKTIPEELKEAAMIDGAGIWQRFRVITVPLIVPAFTINVTLWLGWGLKVFDYPMAATGGGPGAASWTLAIYVYEYAFPYGKAGYGQAAALVLFVLVFTLSALVTKVLRSKELQS